MNIAVIGAGYVGLVTGAGLAPPGHTVRIGAADPEKVATLSEGGTPFFESELDRPVSEGMAAGLLTFHADNHDAGEDAQVVIIALPTSPAADGSADLALIDNAFA